MSNRNRPAPDSPWLTILQLACLAWLACPVGGLAATGPPTFEPAVAILSLGESVEVLAGARPIASDPMRPAVLAWHASRNRAGAWGSLQPLPLTAAGLPFGLRDAPWRLETAGFGPGQALHHRLLPLSGELGLVGARIEALVDVARIRVASVDAWTVVVAEQAASGAILVRRITAEGESLEMAVAEQFDWPTGWSDGTTLFALDASPEQLFAWGRDASGTVHVATLPHRMVPPLALSAETLVAGALLREGPAVIALAEGLLRLHVLGADGWAAGDAIAWPTPTGLREIVARAHGKNRGELIVAAVDPIGAEGADETKAPSVSVAVHDAKGWSARRRLQAEEKKPTLLNLNERASPADPAPSPVPSPGLANRAMLAGAVLTSLIALAVLIGQLKALRK